MMATLEATSLSQDAALLQDYPVPFAGDDAGAGYFRSDYHHRFLAASLLLHLADGRSLLLMSGERVADGELLERFLNEDGGERYRASRVRCREGMDFGAVIRAYNRQLGLRQESDSGGIWTLLSRLMVEARNGITRILLLEHAELLAPGSFDELLRFTALDEPHVMPVVLLASAAFTADPAAPHLALLQSPAAAQIAVDRLAPEEVEAFIRYQLNPATGRDTIPFPPETIGAIAEAAGGSAAAVNRLARQVLEESGFSLAPPAPVPAPASALPQVAARAEESMALALTAAKAPLRPRLPAGAIAVLYVAGVALSGLALLHVLMARAPQPVAAPAIVAAAPPPVEAPPPRPVERAAPSGDVVAAVPPPAEVPVPPAAAATPPDRDAAAAMAPAEIPAPPPVDATPPNSDVAAAAPPSAQTPAPPPAETALPPGDVVTAAALPSAQTPTPAPAETAPPSGGDAAAAAPPSAQTPALPPAETAPASGDVAAASAPPSGQTPAPPPVETAPASADLAAAAPAPSTDPEEEPANPVGKTADTSAGPPAQAEPADAAPTGDVSQAAPADSGSAPPLAPTEPAAAPTPALPVQEAAVSPANAPRVDPPAAPPPAAPAVSDPAAAVMVHRGEELLAAGDIVPARRFFERAALVGDAAALCGLGKSYDPIFLRQLRAIGPAGDAATAIGWYRRAAAAGSEEARRRLERLGAVESGGAK